MTSISPVQRAPGDHATNAVHTYLRQLILDGALPPGSFLNQVTLAAELRVSRTPVREAIRMLLEEGLVEAEPQKRARVVGFDPAHLEAVYTQRVLLESLAAAQTAAKAKPALVNRLDKALKLLDRPPEARMDADWRAVHTAFHLDLIGGINGQFQRVIKANMERGDHYRLNYRLMYETLGSHGWDTSPAEHRAIVEAFRRRDGDGASAALAVHLARTALTLIGQLAPRYNPVVLRRAVALTRGEDPPPT